MRRVTHAALSLRAVLRNENLRRVELAWGAAIGAEWSHFVALGVFAYNTGGASAVGIAGFVRMVPAALVAPAAASLGDRHRRERFLLAVLLLGACALSGSAAAFWLGLGEIPIFALAGVSGVASTLVRPAQQSLLPSLARTPEELIAANGASSTIESLATLAGPLLAGVLVSLASVGVVFAVGAAACLVAATLMARVRVEGRVVLPAPANEPLLHILGAGFQVIAREPRARLVIGLLIAQTFVRGCLNVLIVVAAFRIMHADASAVGYMTAALGAGGLIGAFGAFSLDGSRLAALFGASLVMWGIPIALVAPTPYLVTALVLLAVVGAANSLEDVAAFTLLQRIVPDEVLARTLGVFWGLAMGGVGIGSLVATGLIAAVGLRPALIAVGALLPLLALASWRRLVEIDRTVASPAQMIAVLNDVPMFAPLPLAAKEHLAESLVTLEVPSGECVIREGETGDRFYLVESGEFEITGNGVRGIAREGDHFGEIALLRDVPRTATVKAVIDSRVYALERDYFLAAVTGHSGARAVGETVVESRLARTASPS